MQNRPGFTKGFKLLFKVLLTAVAIFLVLRKVDIRQSLNLVKGASPYYLAAGFILFNISKFLSAIRLNSFFSSEGIYLSQSENLRLYYRGMFYNLLLPGGISGDAYKAILIRRSLLGSLSTVVRALVLDRANGLLALLVLLVAFFLSLQVDVSWLVIALVALLGLASYPALYFVYFYFFRNQLGEFFTQSFYSLAVQSMQVCCAYALLISLGVRDLLPMYLFLFLVSSIASVIPVTIGGLGIRELVFIWAAPLASINSEQAVGFGLLFFLVTAISSFSGALIGPVKLLSNS